MLAEFERDLESGKQPFVETPGGKMGVTPEVMRECGLTSGQCVSQQMVVTILQMHIAETQARIAIEKAQKGDRP